MPIQTTQTVGVPGGGALTQQGGAYIYRPQESDLVAGRLRQLQSRANPLVQASRRDALRRANARGDLNSSYAAGAAEQAAYAAMLPVAQQDSDTLTRVNMQNLQSIQNQQNYEQALNALQGQEIAAGAMAAAQRDIAQQERELGLQLQRERLAFEGEQAGFGREHDIGMFERSLGRDLTMQERDFLGRMGLGEQDIWGRRQLQEDAYGQDIGRAGFNWGMQRDLANQQADIGARQSYLDFQIGSQQFMQTLIGGFLASAMQNPDQFGNVQALDGMLQFIGGNVPGSFMEGFWDSFFG